MEEEGPFHVLKEMLAVRFSRSRDYLVEIDDKLKKIIKGFQEMLDFKKQRENECEEIIRYLNECRDWDIINNVRTKIEPIAQKMEDYLAKASGPPGGSVASYKEDREVRITRQRFYGLEDENLNLCFLSLSIFPKDCVLKKRDIILGWVCDGSLEATREDRAAEEVGEEYFAKLLDSGLICPVYNRGSGTVKGCTLQSYVKTMAVIIARDMSSFGFDSRVVLQGDEATAISCPLDVSHIFNFNKTRVNMDNLSLSPLVNIRVLRLGSVENFCRDDHWTIVKNPNLLLECLVHLKKLRYLGLQGLSGVKELPPNIDLLSELVVMDLQACHDLEKLPSKISDLDNLTHLNVWGCHLLRNIPLGGKILKLEVLKGLVLGNSVDAGLTYISGSNIEWPNLRKLNIYFKNKTEVSKYELWGLENLKTLRSITISCGLYNRSISLPLSYLDMNWLPKDIEKLDLRCYPREGAPLGLLPSKLKKLKRLYLRGGNLQSLDALVNEGDRVWQVEVLRLRHLTKLKLDASLMRRGFPCLKYIEIHNCPNTYNLPGDKWNLEICDVLEMYSALEEMEQWCFHYLSIFPEGFIMSKRNLRYQWIGEAKIDSLENGKVKMQRFLKKLERLSLIKINYKGAQEKIDGLTLHPSFRQLAFNLAIGKQFLMPVFESNATKLVQYSLDNKGDSFSLFVNLSIKNLEDIVPYFSRLTALQLGSWTSSKENGVRILDPSILENLQNMKRLRYLGLQGTCGVTRISKSIDGLSDLKVLDLKGCLDLKTLPDSVADLRQLKVLDVSECPKLQEVPSQLLKLQTLEVFKGLVVTSGLERRRGMSNILEQNHGSITKLSKLTINIRSDKVFLDNGLSELSSLVSLLSLTITWEINTTVNFANEDVSWCPPCLRKLNLRCYPLEVPPKIAPETQLCLKKIGFQGGNLKTLSGLFEGVERLILHNLEDLQLDWSEVRYLFPSLKYVEVFQCPKVHSFPSHRDGVWKRSPIGDNSES